MLIRRHNIYVLSILACLVDGFSFHPTNLMLTQAKVGQIRPWNPQGAFQNITNQ